MYKYRLHFHFLVETLLNLASAAVSKGKPETLLKVLSEPNLFLADVLLTKEAGELYLRELEKIVSPSSQPKNVLVSGVL